MRKPVFLVLILILIILGWGGNSYAGPDSTYINNGQIVENSNFSENDDFKVIEAAGPWYNRLLDYAHGYALDYPCNMWVDVSLSAVKVLIADEESQIEIYHDDFHNTIHSASAYTVYSNRFLGNTGKHLLEMNKVIHINGLKTHLLQWHRDKLPGVVNDKNYYLSAEIIVSNHEVYSVFIKSSRPLDDFMPVIDSFRLIEKKGKAGIASRFENKNGIFNEETAAFYQRYFGEEASLQWGIFALSAFSDADYFASLEKRLDYHFDFLVWYHNLDEGFPAEVLRDAYENKRYVELTLQTTVFDEQKNPDISYDILDGQYDDYFNDYARQLKDFGHPVLFRLNNEMNGDWCNYCSYYSCKDTEIYKAVWKYIYNIFAANGVSNAVWVWNPHDISFPGFKWNHYLNYFPGEKYVDIVGLTGYNTGTYYSDELWRDFLPIYNPLYDEYSRVFAYPFMISEFSCSSVGGDKRAWIEEMFAHIESFSNIKVAIWFNGVDLDSQGNPARLYRLDENDGIIEAFAKGLHYGD